MKVTNNSNLPQPIVDAVSNDKYSKGHSDYSITGLLKPPRATALERTHRDELVVDVADMIWLLLGNCAHELLDRAEVESIPRDRMYMTVGGKIISGATDRFVVRGGVLQDYKVTSVWKVKKSLHEFDHEWAAQLNGYVMLLAQAGYKVERAEIVPIMRDWSKPKAAIDGNYPQMQCIPLSAPIWPLQQTLEFFERRVHLHEHARRELPRCTDEERWKKPDMWAVIKNNASRAVKLYLDESLALNHARDFTNDKDVYRVEKRPGEAKRCANYCLAAKFCTQNLEDLCTSSLPWPSLP